MSQDSRVSTLVPGFNDYMVIERQFARETVVKYSGNIQWFLRHIGDMPVENIRGEHFFAIKSSLMRVGSGSSRIVSVFAAVKCLLEYARIAKKFSVFNPEHIRSPRFARRKVVYLTPEELKQFVGAIRLEAEWTEQPRKIGYCFRALVEVLAVTGMRLSEALALNRDSINFDKREAVVIGKGNKERTVFFTPRSLEWLNRYLMLRSDDGEALFGNLKGRRLTTGTVDQMFKRLSIRAGMVKRVSPHILRHTAATHLLKNGCPIGHIKEVLGHDHLETTCKYYLGVLDKDEVKRAFDEYTSYAE